MWGVVIFVSSVMRVVEGVPLWVVCVSSCRCCVFVVHPVAILSAVFCVICSLCLMLVVTIWWKHTRVWFFYGFVCCNDRFLLFPPCC